MELCLGTVQLGMSYGIAGGVEFTHKEAIQLLRSANELGISVFDTASAYGNAEILLGEFISTYNRQDIKIISKSSGNADQLEDYLRKTIININKNQIDGYLFHDAKMLYDEESIETLISFKKADLVRNIGVSIYSPEDALYAAKLAWVDYIQIPYNTLDQRLDKLDFFKIAKNNNKMIFARSTLLQGLLTMPLKDVQEKLEFSYAYLKKYVEISSKYHCTQLESAIQFVKANDKIDYIVFGVYNEGQLKQFIDIFKKNPINFEMVEEMRYSFCDVNEKVIKPNQWHEV